MTLGITYKSRKEVTGGCFRAGGMDKGSTGSGKSVECRGDVSEMERVRVDERGIAGEVMRGMRRGENDHGEVARRGRDAMAECPG
jgi:hypothetical protein